MVTLYHICNMINDIICPAFIISGSIGVIICILQRNFKKLDESLIFNCGVIICGFIVLISIIMIALGGVFSVILSAAGHSSIKEIYPDAHNFHYIKSMDISSFDTDEGTIYYKYNDSTNKITIYNMDMNKEGTIDNVLN